MIVLAVIIAFYVTSIVGFSFIYYILYRRSLRPRIITRRSGVNGLKQQFPAFYPSEKFKARTINEAINDLRLLDFLGEARTDRWHSFDRGQMLKQSGMDQEELAEQRLLDISATELLERVFEKYGSVALYPKSSAPIDSIHDLLIPALDCVFPDAEKSGQMAREYGGRFSIEAVELGRRVAEEVRQAIPRDQLLPLRDISNGIKRVAERNAPTAIPWQDFKEVLYSQVLMALSVNNGAEVSFDNLKNDIRYLDFLYYASVTGTVNVPAELTPARGLPRCATAVQLLLSFIMLGIIVGAMVNALQL